jgi:hypothetical protein
MVQSHIEQLQIGATDGSSPVGDLLRKAKLASKLKAIEFAKWADFDLNGYTEEQSPPLYRQVRGKVKYWHPTRGWMPALGLNEVIKAFINQLVKWMDFPAPRPDMRQ